MQSIESVSTGIGEQPKLRLDSPLMIATEPCPPEAAFTSTMNWLRSRLRSIKEIVGSNLVSDMQSEGLA